MHFLHIAFLIAFTFFKDFALEKCVTMVKVKMVKMRFELGHLLAIIININIYFYSGDFDILEK